MEVSINISNYYIQEAHYNGEIIDIYKNWLIKIKNLYKNLESMIFRT